MNNLFFLNGFPGGALPLSEEKIGARSYPWMRNGRPGIIVVSFH